MWRDIGTLTLDLTWQIFSIPTTSNLFRASYIGNLQNINTFAYLRQYYSIGEVGKAIRLYPKPEQEIIELSIPDEFVNGGIIIRYLGAMKYPARRFYGQLPDTAWSLHLEEWL